MLVIRSFIQIISIALLQGTYSEVVLVPVVVEENFQVFRESTCRITLRLLGPPTEIAFLKSCGTSSSVCPFHSFASTWSLCYVISLAQVGISTDEVFLVVRHCKCPMTITKRRWRSKGGLFQVGWSNLQNEQHCVAEVWTTSSLRTGEWRFLWPVKSEMGNRAHVNGKRNSPTGSAIPESKSQGF